MHISNNLTTIDHRTNRNLSSTCFVSPKATGIVSLLLQFILLVVSVLVVLFFFYHVDGHEYAHWGENVTLPPNPVDDTIFSEPTILDTVPDSVPLDSSANYTAPTTVHPQEVSENNRLPSDIIFNEKLQLIPPTSETAATTNCSSILNTDQVPNTTIYLKLLDAQLNIRELIHISSLIYITICIVWLTSIALLLVSMRFRILDTVFLNAVVLTVASTYAFIHALLLIAVLIYSQCALSWKTMAIVIGCAVTLMCTTVLCTVALALIISWYRHIVSMNNNTKCFCMYGIMGLIKKIKRGPRQAAQEYAMPDVTRHSELPYSDGRDVHVNNFSAF